MHFIDIQIFRVLCISSQIQIIPPCEKVRFATIDPLQIYDLINRFKVQTDHYDLRLSCYSYQVLIQEFYSREIFHCKSRLIVVFCITG